MRYVGVALCFVGVALRCEGEIIGCRVLCVFLASDEGMAAGRKGKRNFNLVGPSEIDLLSTAE